MLKLGLFIICYFGFVSITVNGAILAYRNIGNWQGLSTPKKILTGLLGLLVLPNFLFLAVTFVTAPQMLETGMIGTLQFVLFLSMIASATCRYILEQRPKIAKKNHYEKPL